MMVVRDEIAFIPEVIDPGKVGDVFMVIMAVDPNKKDLKLLVKNLRRLYPNSEVVMFTGPEDAAKYILVNPIDVLFTEIVVRGMTGFGLQKVAEAVQPAVITVLTTAAGDYSMEAIKSRAEGYITKPVKVEDICHALQETKFNLIKKGNQITKFNTGG